MVNATKISIVKPIALNELHVSSTLFKTEGQIFAVVKFMYNTLTTCVS